MYSTVAPASDTNLVGVAKTMVGDSTGTPGLSPWTKTTNGSQSHKLFAVFFWHVIIYYPEILQGDL